MTAAGGIEAAERGATTIADRVVAKIAAQAAREALRGVRAHGRGMGLPEGGRPPHAMVVVHRNSARVRITLELGYPSDIGTQCGAVRHQVVRRVMSLAGMEVPEVAVHVERLHSPHTRDGDKGGGRVR
ncbi:Asp23/Gls24 family envelope stress response protein [Streptomyces ficellus]|uniref:Asp23/Gls24 family envelope stress response protein n=1 Tax=Streptomyces ficellus TaxID=1977088 RepID=A0ABT7ZE53_9ACTN|nr:Asp23/Gls24 family envelope stress response protein [Streptomyces ficellus]MDN3297793.1 Asp23/Gls24 family envelope stress response protein [Streptomyces ficellus]